MHVAKEESGSSVCATVILRRRDHDLGHQYIKEVIQYTSHDYSQSGTCQNVRRKMLAQIDAAESHGRGPQEQTGRRKSVAKDKGEESGNGKSIGGMRTDKTIKSSDRKSVV